MTYEDNFDSLAAGAFERFVEAAPCDSCVYRNRETTMHPVFGESKVLAFRDATHGVMEIIYGHNHHPLEITIRSFAEDDNSYRWIHPEFAEKHREVFDTATGSLALLRDTIVNEHWSETESISDILDKVEKIITGQPHDHKVVVVIDMDEEHIELVKAKAEAEGITVDEYVEKLLRKQLAKLDAKASGLTS